jgi:hypothetical protein
VIAERDSAKNIKGRTNKCCFSAGQTKTKPNKEEPGHNFASITHKASDHHLHHE